MLGAFLDEVAMRKIALACHFSLDLLCDKTSSLPVVNDHVSVRNWSPSPFLHVATESANVISLAATHEPALMQYVLDGSTWSFISPFLDLLDTFNMRTTATSWNSATKYPGGALLFFLLHNAPERGVDKCRVASSSNNVTKKEESHRMVDLGVRQGAYGMTADFLETVVLCSS